MRVIACLLAIVAFLSSANSGEMTDEAIPDDILFAAAVRKEANLKNLATEKWTAPCFGKPSPSITRPSDGTTRSSPMTTQ